jgi:hypothetical protein
MNLNHEGLSLWYGTPDAAAPGSEGVVPRRGATLIVGVHPANPTNSLIVRYRTDGGIVQTVPGCELRTDYVRQIQYFEVRFPTFVTGDVVEYAPLLMCGGRQVPAPHLAERFPSRFRLAPKETPLPERPPKTAPSAGRFGIALGFVANVAITFDEPQFIGETAAGMRINFFVREGTVEGDGVHAKVYPRSADHMIVRRDGMGEVHIRAAFATDDGAILDVESQGFVDFGPDGYRRAQAHQLPDRSPLTLSPLITTRHPKYKWLSRVQCIGVGHTHLDVAQVSYRVFAATPRNVAATG